MIWFLLIKCRLLTLWCSWNWVREGMTGRMRCTKHKSKNDTIARRKRLCRQWICIIRIAWWLTTSRTSFFVGIFISPNWTKPNQTKWKEISENYSISKKNNQPFSRNGAAIFRRHLIRLWGIKSFDWASIFYCILQMTVCCLVRNVQLNYSPHKE